MPATDDNARRNLENLESLLAAARQGRSTAQTQVRAMGGIRKVEARIASLRRTVRSDG